MLTCKYENDLNEQLFLNPNVVCYELSIIKFLEFLSYADLQEIEMHFLFLIIDLKVSDKVYSMHTRICVCVCV